MVEHDRHEKKQKTSREHTENKKRVAYLGVHYAICVRYAAHIRNITRTYHMLMFR